MKKRRVLRRVLQVAAGLGVALLSASGCASDVDVVTPRLGQSFEPRDEQPHTHWWPRLPFVPASQNPIVSRQVD